MRQVKEDLQIGDYTVPLRLVCSRMALQELYTPTIPEDWLTLERNVASWGFGGGPHRCPGRFLAKRRAGIFWSHVGYDGLGIRRSDKTLKQHYIPGLFPASGLIIGSLL
jgi:hypothetical protein